MVVILKKHLYIIINNSILKYGILYDSRVYGRYNHKNYKYKKAITKL